MNTLKMEKKTTSVYFQGKQLQNMNPMKNKHL